MQDHLTIRLAAESARNSLLEQRTASGHWDGKLSSSALSTATAVLTLHLYAPHASVSQQRELKSLIQRGAAWLVETQNPDGGWGDSVLSLSNISTTALVWGSLSAIGDQECCAAIASAETWLSRAAGSTQPEQLAAAILRRYGRDHTFSVPILTHLALCGRLGDDRNAWQRIPQLPFELAACPHQWFKWLKLPVVSYALPALIAIGQLRHKKRPSRNPVLLFLRNRLRARTLRKLLEIQPESGGYLEATPLTSFVSMSLIGAGEHVHPVVTAGIKFLKDSVRDDGSWPIDTNLATWVTTLAINGLTTAQAGCLGEAEKKHLLDWLLACQYRIEHRYTHAAPGGWAWTDLSGGVPDADDTSGALLAIHRLQPDSPHVQAAAEAGVGWLLNLQNRDGGMPTFCRGWGLLPFDRSSADITAHALRAFFAWRWTYSNQERLDKAIRAGLIYLLEQQRSSGAWAPLWFGNQHSAEETNLAYGTSRVLRMLADLPLQFVDGQLVEAMTRGLHWLLAAQNDDGGWGGESGTPSSIEETALAVESLAATLHGNLRPAGNATADPHGAIIRAVQSGSSWLAVATETGSQFPASPIGFYFAKLWYFERLYPYVYTVAALGQAERLLDTSASEVASSASTH